MQRENYLPCLSIGSLIFSVATCTDTPWRAVQDMAWAEVSLATSPEHEELLDALHELYYRPSVAKSAPTNDSTVEEKRVDYAPRSNPWMPHLSLCYDNPEQIDITLSRPSIEEFIQKQCPTLANLLDDSGDGDIKFTRAVSGIALWRTAGTMAEWECLDRFVFPTIG